MWKLHELESSTKFNTWIYCVVNLCVKNLFMMTWSEKRTCYRKIHLFTTILHMFRIGQFTTLNYTAFHQGFYRFQPTQWTELSGWEITLWNVSSDILQSRKWICFCSLHFYLHLLLKGLCWKELPFGGLTLFCPFIRALPKQFLAVTQCAEKAPPCFGATLCICHQCRMRRHVDTLSRKSQWGRKVSQLLTLLLLCAKSELRRLQEFTYILSYETHFSQRGFCHRHTMHYRKSKVFNEKQMGPVYC